MANFTAVYDACVLYPAPLRDFLLRLAMTELFRARWTDHIHEEWNSHRFCYSFERKRYTIIFHKYMGKHADSTDSKILRRIRSRKRGWVFMPDSFKDLGTRQAVDLALMRHRNSGLIRQLARGLYDYPRTDPQLGLLQPSTDDIASALAGRDATRLQPSGAYAANLLGLSRQVPMKVVYLTDGSTRTVQIGKRQIILKHTTPRNMATAGKS